MLQFGFQFYFYFLSFFKVPWEWLQLWCASEDSEKRENYSEKSSERDREKGSEKHSEREREKHNEGDRKLKIKMSS